MLLRVTVGLIALTHASVRLGRAVDLPPLVLALLLLLAASGVCLLAGAFTPIAGIYISLYGIGMALSWVSSPVWNALGDKVGSPEVIAVSVAVALLGPGAFSVDARRFGRREIVIPPAPRNPEL